MTVTASKYPLRKNDLYETEEWATHAVCRVLKKLGLWRGVTVWEPAAGNHAMVRPLYSAGAKTVITSDKFSYPTPHCFIFDFFDDHEPEELPEEFDLVTNPPYGRQNRVATKFAERALLRCDGVVALLLTAKFDSGSTRTHLFRDCSRFVAKVPLLDRLSLMLNETTGTEDHAWYIWGPRNHSQDYPRIIYEGKQPSEVTHVDTN